MYVRPDVYMYTKNVFPQRVEMKTNYPTGQSVSKGVSVPNFRTSIINGF